MGRAMAVPPTRRRVLVVGGGIAGSAAAWWLHHTGCEVVLVDAAHASHTGGFVLDVDTSAQRILRAMGAEHVVEGTSFPSPATSFRFLGGPHPGQLTFSSGGSRLAHRGQLTEALLKHVPDDVDLRLGVRLISLEHRPDDVLARFEDGSVEPFDIIVGADGVNSTVRGLVLAPHETAVYRNGLSHVWLTVDRCMPGTGAVAIGRHRTIVFAYPFPDSPRTQIIAVLPAPGRVFDHRPLVQQVAKALRTMGGELASIADGVLQADDVLLTRFGQVRTARWSTRRVVLIGDAAHCIDPLSGLGAHGALLGATTLATALQRHGADTARAFAEYEQRIRPFVEASQRVTSRAAELVTGAAACDRLATLLGAAGDLARTLPKVALPSGRRALLGLPGVPGARPA